MLLSLWCRPGYCCIDQRGKALGRDDGLMVVGSRNSVLVGRGGDEGGVCGSGHDRGREEGDGNGLIGEEYASLGGRSKRRRIEIDGWRMMSWRGERARGRGGRRGGRWFG